MEGDIGDTILCVNCGIERPVPEFGEYRICKTCRMAIVEAMALERSKEKLSRRGAEKRCPKCKQVKPISEFCENKRSPDGLNRYCKACDAIRKGQWHRKNIKRVAEYDRRKYIRARTKKGTYFPKYTDEEWTALCNRYGNKCLRCWAMGVKLEPDYIVPIRKGGFRNIENVQPLCPRCNNKNNGKNINYRVAAEREAEWRE